MKNMNKKFNWFRIFAGLFFVFYGAQILAQQLSSTSTPPGFELRDDIIHSLGVYGKPETRWPDITRSRATINYIGGFYSAATLSQGLICPEKYSIKPLATIDLMKKVLDWINENPASASFDKSLILWFALDIEEICKK